MPAAILLIGLTLAAAATDIARHKIYNWTTYPGILAALILSAAGRSIEFHGARITFLESLLGLAICGFVMLACFVFFRIGGGDVKLIAMLGAFLGPEQGITAMLWTFVLGGCVGLIVLVWRVGPVRLAARTLRQILWSLRLGHWTSLDPAERAELQPPLYLAPTALAAVLIVLFSLENYIY